MPPLSNLRERQAVNAFHLSKEMNDFALPKETRPELDDLRPKTSRSVVAQLVVFDKQDPI